MFDRSIQRERVIKLLRSLEEKFVEDEKQKRDKKCSKERKKEFADVALLLIKQMFPLARLSRSTNVCTHIFIYIQKSA